MRWHHFTDFIYCLLTVIRRQLTEDVNTVLVPAPKESYSDRCCLLNK
uniref:Uncharacterized protein n=1 Tax=Anguilla anguilla TaxID=7936 RepID=A0A0E9VS81_ANGAN